MRSLGPWLKFSLMAWAISAAIIFAGFLRGFNTQPLLDIGRNLLGATLGGVLFDWLWGTAGDNREPWLPKPSARPPRKRSFSSQKANPAVAHYRQGRAHARNGDLARAIESFSRALRFNPIYADALVSRGIALHHSGDYENAIADLNEALVIDPANAKAYSYRGSIHYRFGNYAAAAADYDQSLRLDPKREVVLGAKQLAEQRRTGPAR
jgi:tetratricopeptide (TPR) repeat protein